MSYVYLASNYDSEVKVGETKNTTQRQRQLWRDRGHLIQESTEVGGGEIERKFVEGYVRLCLAHSGLATPLSLDYFDCGNSSICDIIKENFNIWVEKGMEIMREVIQQSLPIINHIPQYHFQVFSQRIWDRMTYHVETFNSFEDHFTCKHKEEDELTIACQKCLKPLGYNYTIERKTAWVYFTVTR